jgi:hypothetical protein
VHRGELDRHRAWRLHQSLNRATAPSWRNSRAATFWYARTRGALHSNASGAALTRDDVQTKQRLIALSANATLEDALRILAEKNIISSPVSVHRRMARVWHPSVSFGALGACACLRPSSGAPSARREAE